MGSIDQIVSEETTPEEFIDVFKSYGCTESKARAIVNGNKPLFTGRTFLNKLKFGEVSPYGFMVPGSSDQLEQEMGY